jgi:Sulfotransferase family
MNPLGTEESVEPYVFLVGCARSGTTLLQRLVDAHPQIAITPEMHWITDYFREGKWLGPEGRVTGEQLADMIVHKRFRQFDFTPEQFRELLDDDAPTPYVPFLNRLFALYGKVKRKPLVGNKTPAYVRRLPRLHALWPRAKFVHLIRDGRDVCLSVMNWNHAYRTAGRYSTWAEDPAGTTALWWERKVRLGRQGGRALPSDLYYELRYDDLVCQPEDECRKLCAFLGLPFGSAMLRFHEGKVRHEPGLDAKKAWLPITPGLRDWRTQLPPADLERFEAVAGPLLDELGYRRGCTEPSPVSHQHAARLRTLFVADLKARDEVVPESWSVFA